MSGILESHQNSAALSCPFLLGVHTRHFSYSVLLAYCPDTLQLVQIYNILRGKNGEHVDRLVGEKG